MVDTSDQDDGERRAHPRADVSTTAIVLARHNAGVELVIDSISVGGARLVGEIAVVVGEYVQILFESDGHPIDVRGEVVRAEKVDMVTDHVALRFVDTSDETKELLRRLVERLLEIEEETLMRRQP